MGDPGTVVPVRTLRSRGTRRCPDERASSPRLSSSHQPNGPMGCSGVAPSTPGPFVRCCIGTTSRPFHAGLRWRAAGSRPARFWSAQRSCLRFGRWGAACDLGGEGVISRDPVPPFVATRPPSLPSGSVLGVTDGGHCAPTSSLVAGNESARARPTKDGVDRGQWRAAQRGGLRSVRVAARTVAPSKGAAVVRPLLQADAWKVER